jgi:hypothetical protein
MRDLRTTGSPNGLSLRRLISAFGKLAGACASERLLDAPSPTYVKMVAAPQHETRTPRVTLKLALRTAIVAIIIAVAVLATSLATAGAARPDSDPSSLTWSAPESIDAAPPYGFASLVDSLSCASRELCLATTEAPGDLISSTEPASTTGGAWHVLPTKLISEGATGYALAGSSCVTSGSSPFCVANGRNLNTGAEPGIVLTSTEPTGGASAWHKSAFSTGFIDAPSCAAEGAEVACIMATFEPGGDKKLETSTDPEGGSAAWDVVSPGFAGEGGSIRGTSCPSKSFCAAATYEGEFSASAKPTEQSAWSKPTNVGIAQLEEFSCPTTTFCLGAGRNASDETELAVSEDPTAGAMANWKISKPAGIEPAVSCEPDSGLPTPRVICLAQGTGDTALEVSTDGAQSWSPETFPGEFESVFGGPLSVACPAATLCVAANSNGAFTSSTNAAEPVSASWAPARDLEVTEGNNDLVVESAACPSTSLCLGSDNAGRILTSTDPAKGASSWVVEAPVDPYHSIVHVACPTTSLCVAVDDAGNVLTTESPALGSKGWSQPVQIDGYAIRDLSCPSASLCVAIDQRGRLLTSTNPTGGPSAWSAPIAIDGGEQNVRSLACTSTTFCAVDFTNGLLTSHDPASGASSWSLPVQPAESVYDVTCAGSALCVASGGGGITTTTNPSGGAPSWSAPEKLQSEETVEDLTCPSSTLCVGVVGGDRVVASTEPAAGATTWTESDVLPFYIYQLECPASGLCVALGYSGEVATSTDPSGGIWSTATQPDEGHTPSNGELACPSATLCIFGDSRGSIVTAKGSAVPANTTLPTISGTPMEGEVLTEHPGTWTNTPTSFSYQWERCNSKGATCKPISGAVGTTYTLRHADAGATLRVKETAFDAAGPGATAASEQTPIIVGTSNPPPPSVTLHASFESDAYLGEGAIATSSLKISGTEYGGYPAPLTQFALTLPTGTVLSDSGFATCTKETLEQTGPTGCPHGSEAGAIGAIKAVVAFGDERLDEDATVQTFFAPGGGYFLFTNGHSPVSLEILAEGKVEAATNGHGPTIRYTVPFVSTVPGAPYVSITELTLSMGAFHSEGDQLRASVTAPAECHGRLSWEGEAGFRETESAPEAVSALEPTSPCPAIGPRAPSQTTATVSRAPGLVEEQEEVVYSATVEPTSKSGSPPTGVVSFLEDGNLVYECQEAYLTEVAGSSQATATCHAFLFAFLSREHLATARYEGDSTYARSESPPATASGETEIEQQETERRAREERERAQREQESHSREAREKSEREAKEMSEREATEKRERETRERHEHEQRQPIIGQRAAAKVSTGTVRVHLKGTSGFVALAGESPLPDGTEVDATFGRVLITVATATPGQTQTAEVYGGRFVIEQGHTDGGFTDFVLSLPLTGCVPSRLPTGAGVIASQAKHRSGPKSRRLWVSENGGKWGTTGRYVSTVVQGTHWLTEDECTKSQVAVAQGKVQVHNLVTHKIKTLTAGQHEVATAKHG